MKKRIISLFLVLLCAIPFLASAKEYNGKEYKTLNLEGALKEESIDFNQSYSENDQQIPIYLFRGNGCGYCRKFLTFVNSITEEYGNYFKLVSFEVWYDSDNKKLMNEVSTFMGEAATGVPYIIIGDEVFAGYTASYDDSIKNAIKKLYDSKDRYDVFEEMEKEKNESKSSGTSSVAVIIWNAVFVVIATVVVILFINYRYNKLSTALESVSKKIKK